MRNNQTTTKKKIKIKTRHIFTMFLINGTACTYYGYWWIGAELKSGVWYWQHSKKRVTYWSRIGGNNYGTNNHYPYAYVYLTKSSAWWGRDTGGGHYFPICQISIV